MRDPKPFTLPACLSAALTVLLACAGAPVMADPFPFPIRVPSLKLTPFKIVTNDGLCLTVNGPGTQADPYWSVSLQPCSEAGTRQTYYVLKQFEDAQAIPQLGPQVVRIALVETFDDPVHGAYNLLATSNLPTGRTVGMTAASTNGAPVHAVFAIERASVQAKWMPINLSPDRAFGIAGARRLRYGSIADCPFVYRNVEGLDVNGTGHCVDAFFPPLPPGADRSCSVESPGRPDTPLQLQIRDRQTATCMNRFGGSSGAEVSLGPCSPTSDNVWTFRPAAYVY